MKLGEALKRVLGDYASLFGLETARTWFLLGAATVLQVAFWYLSTPGPGLRFAPRDPATAIEGIGFAVATLFLAPALLHILTGGSLRELGLRIGDHRFGLAAVAVCAPIGILLMVLSSGPGSGLQAAYPWAGSSIGDSLAVLVVWAAIYGLYYLAFEFFFRGFLLKLFVPAVGADLALWLQAMAATLVHLGKPLPEVIAALPASLLFGVIALRSKSILYPALLHLLIGLTLDVAILARQGALFN
ncbi:MAG TPA: CPBP family intramembrane glutamic endopeptidase [Trueperaceae bacterium]|nr:CPBP family intramembrane glutamic endopeptidase [Trueperaceae bacterium]